MALLYNWLPKPPPLTHLDSAQLNAFHNRLVFDGVAVVISIVLGYTGLVVVSIAESRRRLRLELDKAALDTELAAAREIQRLMVPEKAAADFGYDIESTHRPAAQVGGDFFQVIPLDGGQTLVVVGDVSGKGLSAAMIVSMLIGMLRAISRMSQDPAQILAELNCRLFFERGHGGFGPPVWQCASIPRGESCSPTQAIYRPVSTAPKSHSPAPCRLASLPPRLQSRSRSRCDLAIASP